MISTPVWTQRSASGKSPTSCPSFWAPPPGSLLMIGCSPCRWLRLCVRSRWEEAVPMAMKMATEQGRMKFTRPLFRYLSSFHFSVIFRNFSKNIAFFYVWLINSFEFWYFFYSLNICSKYYSVFCIFSSERCLTLKSTVTKRFQCSWLTEQRCTQSPLDWSPKTWRWTPATPPACKPRNQLVTSINTHCNSISNNKSSKLFYQFLWSIAWCCFFLATLFVSVCVNVSSQVRRRERMIS